MGTKKYYWLKLKNDFFTNKKIKKLRKIAGGDTYTIIYLKMQLLSITNEGKLYFENVEETFAEELALELDEDVENVKVTLMFLIKNGLLVEVDEDEYMLPETIECIGSETESAERVRKHRKLQQEKKLSLQCNTEVTKSNIEKEIEKDKEIDIDKEKEIEKEISNEVPKTTKKFIKPTLEEVRAYCNERNNSIDPESFIDYYECNGWKVGKNPMKDWKAAVRTWERREKDNFKSKTPVRKEIVPEWINEGIKPKWTNQKIEKEKMSPEETKELEDLFEGFKTEEPTELPFEERRVALQEKLKSKYGRRNQ